MSDLAVRRAVMAAVGVVAAVAAVVAQSFPARGDLAIGCAFVFTLGVTLFASRARPH
jgi:hypothetical protein